MFFARTVIEQGFALKTDLIYKKSGSSAAIKFGVRLLICFFFFCMDCYRSRFRFKTGYTERVAAQLTSAAIKFGVKLI